MQGRLAQISNDDETFEAGAFDANHAGAFRQVSISDKQVNGAAHSHIDLLIIKCHLVLQHVPLVDQLDL